MTEQEIERCLERFTMGKATDVMNFDYAGTFAYIQRLKSENATLQERLEKAFPCKVGETVYCIENDDYHYTIESTKVTERNIYLLSSRIKGNPRDAFLSREAAEAHLAELKGEEK